MVVPPPGRGSGRGFKRMCMFAILLILGITNWARSKNMGLPTSLERQFQLENPSSENGPCEPNILYRGPSGLPPLKGRRSLGKLLEARKLTDGAEVGVQRGVHALQILKAWPSCKSFKLIDLWGHQKNYKDIANVGDGKQKLFYRDTVKRLKKFENKTEFFRMLSVEAAQKIDDASLDFVYVDARHDYCGVSEDLEAYFPKLRPGGIMAGHDFMDADEVKKQTPSQDWSVCADGTVNPRAVKGAVVDFAERHGLVASTMYDEGGSFASWMVQKPTRMECVEQMGAFGTS